MLFPLCCSSLGCPACMAFRRALKFCRISSLRRKSRPSAGACTGFSSCLESSWGFGVRRINFATPTPPFESPTFSTPGRITRVRCFRSLRSSCTSSFPSGCCASGTGVDWAANSACWSSILYINSCFLNESTRLIFNVLAICRKSASNLSFSSKMSYIDCTKDLLVILWYYRADGAVRN